MAAVGDDDLVRALDLTIERVLREVRTLPKPQQDEALRAAMRELRWPSRREPRQWDTADISYDHPRETT